MCPRNLLPALKAHVSVGGWDRDISKSPIEKWKFNEAPPQISQLYLALSAVKDNTSHPFTTLGYVVTIPNLK